MKTLLLTTLMALAVCVSGCTHIVLFNEDITAEYTRFGNQSIGKLVLTKTAEGYSVGIEKQLSDTEIAFQLGAASVKVGGGQK